MALSYLGPVLTGFMLHQHPTQVSDVADTVCLCDLWRIHQSRACGRQGGSSGTNSLDPWPGPSWPHSDWSSNLNRHVEDKAAAELESKNIWNLPLCNCLVHWDGQDKDWAVRRWSRNVSQCLSKYIAPQRREKGELIRKSWKPFIFWTGILILFLFAWGLLYSVYSDPIHVGTTFIFIIF